MRGNFQCKQIAGGLSYSAISHDSSYSEAKASRICHELNGSARKDEARSGDIELRVKESPEDWGEDWAVGGSAAN